LLINGVAYAAIFVVVAVLIRRFAGELAWRSSCWRDGAAMR
jgi:hypothetical protein